MNAGKTSKPILFIVTMLCSPVVFSQSPANLAQSGYCYARASFLVEQVDILFEHNKLEQAVLNKLVAIAAQSKKRLLDLKTESGASAQEASIFIDNLAYRLDEQAQNDKATYSGLGKSVTGDVLTNCQVFLVP